TGAGSSAEGGTGGARLHRRELRSADPDRPRAAPARRAAHRRRPPPGRSLTQGPASGARRAGGGGSGGASRSLSRRLRPSAIRQDPVSDSSGSFATLGTRSTERI